MSVVMQIASLNCSKSRANKVGHSLGSVIQKRCYQISRSINGDKKGSCFLKKFNISRTCLVGEGWDGSRSATKQSKISSKCMLMLNKSDLSTSKVDLEGGGRRRLDGGTPHLTSTNNFVQFNQVPDKLSNNYSNNPSISNTLRIPLITWLFLTD